MKESASEQYLARLFSGIAHEIRNPLQGIIAAIAAMSCQIEDRSPLKPFLDMINRETSRINSIIDDLNGLGRPITVDSHPHNCGSLVEDALRNLNDQITSRKVRIKTQIEANCSLRVDSHLLTRAIEAVLMNAIESADQGVQIDVQVKKLAQNKVELIIRDNGSGIGEEDLKEAREPFFSTRPRQPGLGLTIADRVVRAHNGELEIKSQLARGTEVRFLLPQ